MAHVADRRNHVVSYVLVELLHGGLQLELNWLSSVELDVELDVELVELCSVELVVFSLTEEYTSDELCELIVN